MMDEMTVAGTPLREEVMQVPEESKGSFDEYSMAEANFPEMAAEAAHQVRLKIASAQELYDQMEDQKAALEFSMDRLKKYI